MSTKVTNWIINEENFQKLYDLYLNRLININPLDHPIPEELALRMIELVKDLKNKNTGNIKDYYKLYKTCLDEIMKKDIKTLSFHFIQIDDTAFLVENNIDNIKNNEFQFAVSFDNESEYFLICDVPKPIDITHDFPKYKKLFANNIKPEMDKYINNLTKGIKTENTSTVYVTSDSLKKYTGDIYIHTALSDINLENIFHSITHLYNFTIVVSSADLTKPVAKDIKIALEDVYKTCKPYCSGTGGGII